MRACRCCGLPDLVGVRGKVRVCPMCDDCDGLHGDALQARMMSGEWLDPYIALARAIIDDAQLTNRIVFVGEGEAKHINVPNPPRRWEVMIARALLRNEQPDLHTVMNAVLLPFFGLRASPSVMALLRGELLEALQAFDASIFDVEVSIDVDVLDRENLQIKVCAKTPALGMTFDADSAGVIPPDIMARPRGEA